MLYYVEHHERDQTGKISQIGRKSNASRPTLIVATPESRIPLEVYATRHRTKQTTEAATRRGQKQYAQFLGLLSPILGAIMSDMIRSLGIAALDVLYTGLETTGYGETWGGWRKMQLIFTQSRKAENRHCIGL